MSETKKKPPQAHEKPFRVSHDNGDVVAGFEDLESAKADAIERNQQAIDLGLPVRYHSGRRPPG